MTSRAKQSGRPLEGFVYRVPGPGGDDFRWIARSVHGHVAQGKTPEGAARNLEAGMKALARAAAMTFSR